MVRRFGLGSAICFAMLLAAGGTSPVAATADVPLPTGSYLSSCKVLSFDATTGVLNADCGGENVSVFDGKPTTPSFNVTGCKEGSIWNDNRQLYCYAATAWGNDRVIPPGSYIATCTDRMVVGGALLLAQCGVPGGGSRKASLDLRSCTWGGDISNQNGALRCMTLPIEAGALSSGATLASPFASQPAVVKPVTVEPGVVKPVNIAPLAPADPAATEDAGDGKKKKRRKDRGGERG